MTRSGEPKGFFGLSHREAMEVAAAMAPAQLVPERTLVTPVREPAPIPAMVLVVPSEATAAAPVAAAPSPAPRCLPVGTSRPVSAPARAEVQPLTGERSPIHVTVDRGFHARLEEARDALSHAHPNASDGDILELAVLVRRSRGDGSGGRVGPGPHPSRAGSEPCARRRRSIARKRVPRL